MTEIRLPSTGHHWLDWLLMLLVIVAGVVALTVGWWPAFLLLVPALGIAAVVVLVAKYVRRTRGDEDER